MKNLQKQIVLEQIKRAGGHYVAWMSSHDVDHAYPLIGEGEVIRFVYSCYRMGGFKTCTIFLTNRNLIIYAKDIILGSEVSVYRLDEVSSIQSRRKFLLCNCVISTSGGKHELQMLSDGDIAHLSNKVAELRRENVLNDDSYEDFVDSAKISLGLLSEEDKAKHLENIEYLKSKDYISTKEYKKLIKKFKC